MNYLPDAALFLLFFALLLGASASVSSPKRPLIYAFTLPALGFLGVWATLFYFAGLAGWLQPLPFWIGAVALLGGTVVWKWRQGRANLARLGASVRGLTVLERILAFYLSLVWLLMLVLGLAPSSSGDYDSLVYHLAVPAQWLRQGRVSELPFDHHSYFPFVGEMLYALALGVRGLGASGTVFAHLFHWAMFVLGALILMALGRRAGGKTAGLWAAVLFVSLPMAQAEATTAYVDLTFSAFAWAGIALFAEALFFTPNAAMRRTNWLGAGVFCGLCLGSKYLGWLVFGFLGIWLLVVSLRDQISKKSSGETGVSFVTSGAGVTSGADMVSRVDAGVASTQELALNAASGEAVSRSERWLRLAWLALPALLLGGFWYVRNALWTGNPVFPFAYSVFGGRGWTSAMAAGYSADQARFGFGKSALDLLLLPWRLAMTPLSIGVAQGQPKGFAFWPLDASVPAGGDHYGFFDVPIGDVLLAVFPGPVLLALGMPAFLARRKGAFVGFAAWMFAFLWAFWALSSQQVRYLFPALGLLCVLGGWVVATRIARFRLASLSLGVGLSAWMLLAPGVSLWRSRGNLPVLSGTQTPEAYLRRSFAGYNAMSWIGANTPETSRVAVYGEPRDFYLPRPYFWADDQHNNLVDYGKIKTPAQLARALRSLGATHVLVNRDPGRTGGVFGPPVPLFDQMVSQGQAHQIYPANGQTANGFQVYVLN